MTITGEKGSMFKLHDKCSRAQKQMVDRLARRRMAVERAEGRKVELQISISQGKKRFSKLLVLCQEGNNGQVTNKVKSIFPCQVN